MEYYLVIKRNELSGQKNDPPLKRNHSTKHGGNLNAHCQVKEANLKRLYPMLFQLYDFLEKAKLDIVQRSGIMEEGGMNRWRTGDF